MKTIAIVSLLASLTSFVAAAGLPADPNVFAELVSWINTAGLTQATTANDFTAAGARGAELVAPVAVTDVEYFTLNATTATEDATGSLLLTAPGDIFINCSVPVNAAGENNYLWLSWNDTGAAFFAYGDAQAAFVPAATTGTGSRKRDDAAPAAATPAVTPTYVASDSVLNPTAIINPFCPSAATATTSGTTGGSRRRRSNSQFGRSRLNV